MQYTIGDVLTFIGLIVGLLVSIWASLVGFALVFPHKAEHARTNLRSSPWICLVLGAALLVLGAFFSVILLNLHNPLTTLLGWGLIIYMLAIMVIGGSGLALVMGDRMQKMDRRCSELRGLSRSAGLMVLCTLVPMFGWAMSVIIWMASMGAGFQAVFMNRRQAIPIPPIHATSAAGPSDPPEFTV
jgi:hypothetical protein